MAWVVGLSSPREVAGWWGVTMEVGFAGRHGGWRRAGVSEVPDLGSFNRGVKLIGFGSGRWRWEGVALEVRRVMRVRRVRSYEEGRAEREHERSREEPHLRDPPEKGGHRIVYSRCP